MKTILCCVAAFLTAAQSFCQTNSTRIAPSAPKQDTNRVTKIPLVGDETPVAAIIASPRNYLGQAVIICGCAKMDDYYDFGYDNASKTHFSIIFWELTKDDKLTNEKLQIYALRGIAQPLVDGILHWQKSGDSLIIRLKVRITSRSFEDGDFDDAAELVDWQFGSEEHFDAWFLDSANAAARELDLKRRQAIEAQSEAAKVAADELRLKRRAEAQANAVKMYQALADKGDPYGQERMGEFYRDGDGVTQDAAKAKEFFTKSAAQGNRDAAHALDKMNAAIPK